MREMDMISPEDARHQPEQRPERDQSFPERDPLTASTDDFLWWLILEQQEQG